MNGKTLMNGGGGWTMAVDADDVHCGIGLVGLVADAKVNGGDSDHRQHQPAEEKHRPQQLQLLESVLARTALRLREYLEGKKDEEEKAEDAEEEDDEEEEADEKQDEALWKRVKTLVECGLCDDVRLLRWLEQMAQHVVERMGPAKAMRTIVRRLEWVVLRLGLRSLPAICAPRVAHHRHPAPLLPATFHAEADATARVDLAGGWTDTPPITYQCATSPAVLNLSIKVNGKRPLRCRCSRLEQFGGVFYTETSFGHDAKRTLHFPSADAVFANCDRPSQPGSLLCAILVIAGIARERLVGGERTRGWVLGGAGRGLHVRTESDLPHGSGLGASSILAGAVLAALWRLCGRAFDQRELVHAVLRVEQLHTTGGGWQDQIGGCASGGFKLGTVAPDGLRECHWRPVPIRDTLRVQLPRRLALLYTGRTRLAKHLLQQVLLSWAGREERIVRAVQRLSEGARSAEAMLLKGVFPVPICREYNELKKTFTADTEPPKGTALVRELTARGLVEVAWMAGAGGGGFLYVWMAQGRSLDELDTFLAADQQRWAGMSVWRVDVEEREPMLVR